MGLFLKAPKTTEARVQQPIAGIADPATPVETVVQPIVQVEQNNVQTLVDGNNNNDDFYNFEDDVAEPKNGNNL